MRSAQIKQFHFGVGGHIAAVYTDPIHYEDENGQWQEINNTLTLKQNNAPAYAPISTHRELMETDCPGENAGDWIEGSLRSTINTWGVNYG